jgi:hypothetical protein
MNAHPPAARAALRVTLAGSLLGLLAVTSFAVVFVRLVERWRVSPHGVSHHISIVGLSLSYPAANVGAIVVLVLAGLGAVVTGVALFATGRELSAASRLARRLAELDPVPRDGVLVIADERPEAFCAGLFHPRVYVTSGALAALDEPGLRAVLLHERHHARRRDPLRLAAGRVAARSLFFLPALRELNQRQQLLAELTADDSAVSGAAGNRSALARAMLTFSDRAESDGSAGVDPARIDHLLGEPPNWRFPALLCLLAGGLLALIVTVAVLAGREAAGSATLAPPFLSAQPCIVMLALLSCGIASVALLLVRGHRRRTGRSR